MTTATDWPHSDAAARGRASPRPRGGHLVADLRPVPTFSLARLLSALVPTAVFLRLVDRLDAALDHGAIIATLPDGNHRTLGDRGPGPRAIVHLHHWSGLARLMVSGSVGWFRAWMDGAWSSPDLVTVFALFSANRRSLGGRGRAHGPLRWLARARHALHRNDRDGAARNIHAHYDLGNDFYAAWLDPAMSYSSAMFDPAQPEEPLESAQTRKLDAILDRLDLQPGQQLLEIGCGWGSLARRAIDRHGIAYTGLTLSADQAAYARAGLPAAATVAIRDYRDETGVYDAIASIEMVEAVGEQYWPDYCAMLARCLRPGGRAAIQYIAIDEAIFPAYAANADFIQTYVFPGGCLLSADRFRALAAAHGLQWEDQVDFPLDYARTLHRWRETYDAALACGAMPGGFSEGFHRLWRYYLSYCEGGFVGGGITVAQVTLVRG